MRQSKMKKNRIVVTGHNASYIYPWMIMTASLASSTKDDFRMIAGNLNSGLKKKDIQFMKDFADHLGIDLEIMDLTMPKDLETHHGKTSINYLPLLFLDSLDENFVWLDSDLILEPGWEKIFEFGESNSDSGTIVIRAAPDRQATLEQLKKKNTNQAYLINSDKYFNTGVMLLSPKAWKSLNFNKAWQDISRRRPEFKMDFNDQDVLNFLLHNNVEILPREFNYLPGDVHFVLPLITHFAGYPKPWVMSSKAKALYFMREAINWDRPQFRPSREGRFKNEYLDFWKLEEEMLNELRESQPRLYEETIRRRQEITIDLNFQEKLKYYFVRFATIEFQNVFLRKKPTLTGFQKDLW
jgi:lipopolysaccharide biosynthesis glycosyltransferase